MAWSDLLNQSGAIHMLRGAITAERVAHAYLFHGPDGVGKRAVALKFAQTLQCETGGDDACQTCRACNKVKKLFHPDVQVLLPQTSDARDKDIIDRLERLAEEPYAVIDFVRRPSLGDATAASNKHAFYNVERIKNHLHHSMSLKPVEGRYKIVILTDAHLMRAAAANAFLKLLEEPSARTVFVLTTSRLDMMLPTILSRCQRCSFTALTPEIIEQALCEREKVDRSHATTLAHMADGSYSRALDLLQNKDLMADRTMILQYLRISYTREINTQADLIEKIANMGRERIKDILRLALSWIRDLVLCRIMDNEARLINMDQANAISRFVSNLPQADLNAMANLVEDALTLIEANVNTRLVLINLSQSLRHAMRGHHSGKLYIPLTEENPY